MTSRVKSFFTFRSTFPTGTVLTWDTWFDYRLGRQARHSMTIDDDSKMKLEKEFSRIESCEEITRNFFAIPEESRQGIIQLAKFDFSHAEIIAYTNIFHGIKRVYPKVEAHKLLFSHEAYYGRKGYSPEISNSFVDASYKFVNFQKRTTNKTIWRMAASSRTPLYLLIPIYGEQRIIAAIDLWVENISANDCLDDFITLLDRFDEIDNDYPLSWTLGLLTSDICTKLQMVAK